MRRLLSETAFAEAAGAGAVTDVVVYRLAEADSMVAAQGERAISYVLSTGAVARDNHTINPDGWDLSAYRTNPVFLWAHQSGEPPIGRMVDIGVVGNALRGTVEYADADTYPFADTIYRLVKGKFLNAVSVAWNPIKYAYSKDRSRPGGIDFLEQELLEVSQCPVPCEAGALVTARAAGIDTGPIFAWAERVLDGGHEIGLTRKQIETIRRDARMPRSGRRAAADSDWKVGAARDLPVNDTAAWDGPAAEKRIFESAGFDGEKPDTAAAAKAFLFYDAAAPDLKGSYKEPFADIIDGKLTAVRRGLDAAASRLAATDVPQDVKDEAQEVLDAYKPADDAAGGARVIAARPARGLYEVMWLAGTLMDLNWIQECVDAEAAWEGDGSAVPGELLAIVKALGETLVKMTIEEVTEMVGGEDDPVDDAVASEDGPERAARALRSAVFRMLRHAAGPAMAAQRANAVRGLDAATLATLLRNDMLAASGRNALADMILSRQGKVLSADNERCMREAVDHMNRAMINVQGVIDQNNPDAGDTGSDVGADGGSQDASEEARALRQRRLRLLQATAAA